MATIHNPTHFEPSDYEVLDYYDNKRPEYPGFGCPVEAYREDVLQWEHDMECALGSDWRRKKGHCVHCGNGSVRWITVCLHVPTGEHVVFGADCTARLGFANRVAFKLALLQKRAAHHDASVKAWVAREKFVAEHPEIGVALEAIKRPEHSGNTFVKDILGKLDKYGSISPSQIEWLGKSLARDLENAARRAAEAVEVKGEAPVGRVDVTGQVLSIKTQMTDFGEVRKMLVKLENNAKVWCSVPGGSGLERGNTITVRATWERSKDDASFAFGKRPMLVGGVQ